MKNFTKIFLISILIYSNSLIAKNYISKINSFYRNKNFGAAVVNFRHQKSKDQVLEEGITEAGAMSSWIAAGTAYTNHD